MTGAEDFSLAELVRAVARLDVQMQSVGAEVSRMASALGEVRSDVRNVATQLGAHVDRQAERTKSRNKEVDALRADLASVKSAQRDTDHWRWSTTGRIAGLLSVGGLTGGGAAVALARMLGH